MSLELCRICGNNQNLTNLTNLGPEIFDKLKKCANIEIKSDDLLPKLICQQCDRALDMSYLLRKQSEAMQQRLQLELEKKRSTERGKAEVVEEEEEDVQYISDEEFVKEDRDAYNNQTTDMINVDSEHVAMETGEVEEFVAVEQEQEILDTHSESTLVASETEGLADLEGDFDYQRRPTTFVDAAESNESYAAYGSVWPPTLACVDDIESNESYDVSTNKTGKKSNAPQGIVTEDEEDEEEAVDVGGKDDERADDFLHSDSSSNLLRPQDCLSINLMSNDDGSPTPDYVDNETKDTEYLPKTATLPFTCITCHEVFARKKDYKEHIAQHGPNRYQCIQCLASFPTRYRLIRHEAIHTDGEAYKCAECNRKYRMAYNLQRHILSCHSEKAKYQCNTCHLSYTRADVLKRHIAQVHSNKKWHCKLCGMSFRSLYFLNEHKAQKICSKPTPKPGSLTQLFVPSDYILLCPDNKYKCVICNMKFKTVSNYKTHLLIHNNIKPFPCTTCPKSFRTRYALINHERIHSDERPFVCDICFKAFRQVTHLKHHRMLHRPEDMPVKCPECQGGFITKWKLREHLRKEHYTMKAFKCAECPEEFFLKYDLKRHARIVHLRSVNIGDCDSDNEGVKNDGNYIPDGTSDSERSVHVEHNEDKGGEEHYNDLDVAYDTDHVQNVEGTGVAYEDGHKVDTVEETDEVIDIAEDTEHEVAEDDDDVHIVDDNDDENNDNAHIAKDTEHSSHIDMDASSSHMFVFNDMEDENTDTNDLQGISSEPIVDYIHLESSNSCKSPASAAPPASDCEYFDNIIEQEEEILHITEEKIETYTSTSFYNMNDIVQS